MLPERIFIDVQSQFLIQVFEEDAPHIVAFIDDDGVLLAQLVQVGEGGSEHRMGGDERVTGRQIVVLQPRLHARDVADDTVCRQIGHDFLEGRDGVFHRNGVDDQLRLELLHLLQTLKTVTVVGEPQASGVFLIHGYLVVEAEQVDEERSHLACSHH